MGVRLRTTLTATAAVAVALCLASIALFAALDSSLAQSTKQSAAKDAEAKASYVLAAGGSGPGVNGLVILGAGVPTCVPASGAASGAASGGTSGVAGVATCGGVRQGAGADSGPTTGPTTGPTAGPTTDPATGPITDPVIGSDAEPGTDYSRGQNTGGQLLVSEAVQTKDGPVTVTGMAPTAPARAAMSTLTRLLVPGVPVLLALVALFTWLAVGRALRPVSAIRAKLAEITAHDLHERVPEPDTRDEVAALARTVNATLDRLRTAVDAHRQFVADAAHELRSPMAVLRTRLELARPAEKRLAAEALDDVERLQTLTSDLLLLARLDANEPVRAQELDLAQLVAEEAGRRRPRPDVEVALHLTPDLLVDGSAAHLRRLVANLVDNAVRHAAGRVDVTLSREAGHGLLDVTDDGPGIPAEHHRTVFDRFTRLDHARTRDTGGSGLGLPIARDIATAHRATLAVIPAAGGAHLRAVFPLPAAKV